MGLTDKRSNKTDGNGENGQNHSIDVKRVFNHDLTNSNLVFITLADWRLGAFNEQLSRTLQQRLFNYDNIPWLLTIQCTQEGIPSLGSKYKLL